MCQSNADWLKVGGNREERDAMNGEAGKVETRVDWARCGTRTTASPCTTSGTPLSYLCCAGSSSAS